MEQTYRLGRKRASAANDRGSASAEARLGGAGGAAAATLPSRARTLSYGLASFLIALSAMVGAYSWAT